MHLYFTLSLLLLTIVPAAQPSGISKCSPALALKAQQCSRQADAPFPVTLVVQDERAFRLWAAQEGLPVWAAYPAAGVLVLEDRERHFWDNTLKHPGLLFADAGYREGLPELPVPGHNLFVNNILSAQKKYPGQDGGGTTVSVKEYRFDSMDVDFRGRHLPNPRSALTLDPHAGIMTTLIGGGGNSGTAGAGVAPGARLVSSSFIGLLPDSDEDYDSFEISVQNHSYGIAIENYYGAGALAYDVSTKQHPELLHVFSAGNSGAAAPLTGIYAGLTGWANLTGNFKMAKNVLTVGAVDSFYRVLPFSSRGPAYDGRLKPELAAFGQDGSSGAAALVSGTAAVARQAFFETYGYQPSSALLRAILIGAADDLGAPGPDFITGYGNLNLKKALRLVQDRFMGVGAAEQGDSVVFFVQAPPNALRFSATLCWNDLPAAPNAVKALVNDLDLRVWAPGGTEYHPWVLNAAPHPDSLALPARTGQDTLNTVEQVFINNPEAGAYRVVVKGSRIAGSWQEFGISFYWDTQQHFEWTSPLAGHSATAAEEATLRWESTFTGQQGRLEWKPAGAADWRPIADTVSLDAGWHKWRLPDTFAEARVRMRIGGLDFVSDTFLIAPELRLRVGLNCPDSVLLYWSPTGASASYRLWGLGDRYMEPLFSLSDTFVILDKGAFSQPRFAVSAIGQGGVEGPRSPAPDINQQATGCFINRLLAFLNSADQVDLRLEISTLYRVNRIFLEKQGYDGSWTALTERSPGELLIEYTDLAPHPGINTYRALVRLDDGTLIESGAAAAYFTGPAGALVLPNPVVSSGSISVISRFVTGSPRFVLHDAMGKKVLEEALTLSPQDISLPRLPHGIYFWSVMVDGRQVLESGKLAVQP